MDIKAFFNPHDVRDHFKTPFIYADRTIATQGSILLSAPKNDQYGPFEGKEPYRLPEILALLKEQDFRQLPLLSLPDPIGCNSCAGTGKARKELCDECDGVGGVDAKTDFNTYYDLECKSCEGEGAETFPGGEDDCPDCNGLGEAFKPYSPVLVEGVHVDAKLLVKILGEADLMISTDPDRFMLFFKSGVYKGVLMGMKV